MKHPMVKISALSASIFAASSAMAGGFDNSSRGFDIIYGDNNVISTSYGQTAVPMKARIQQEAGSSNIVASGEILDDFQRPQLSTRYHVTENVSCALQYEVPFKAGVEYKDDTLAYGTTSAPIKTVYDSESITAACGYDLALSTGVLKVFGGPKLQKVSGAFTEDLLAEGLGYTGAEDNLAVELDGGTEAGFIAGVSFSIPEIALRASILYHSQIDYTATGTINSIIPAQNAAIGLNFGTEFETTGKAKTFTPQTVELALQSGIAENTLAFVKMRWSEYGKLSDLQVRGGNDGIQGTYDTNLPGGDGGQVTLQELAAMDEGADSLINPNVGMFSNDTFDYSFGLGRRISDQLTLGGSFSGSIKLGGKSADTPVGADSTSLRLPGDTSHTLSFGGEYSVLPNLKVNGGFGYTFINDYVVQTKVDPDTGTSDYRAEFSKTEATSFQLGLTYEI